MTNKPQTVTLAGQDYAVIPLAEYQTLKDAADEDSLDSAIMRRVLDDPNQEWVPADVVKRLANGDHPVRVWREYRGVKANERVAAALNVALDDLV